MDNLSIFEQVNLIDRYIEKFLDLETTSVNKASLMFLLLVALAPILLLASLIMFVFKLIFGTETVNED